MTARDPISGAPDTALQQFLQASTGMSVAVSKESGFIRLLWLDKNQKVHTVIIKRGWQVLAASALARRHLEDAITSLGGEVLSMQQVLETTECLMPELDEARQLARREAGVQARRAMLKLVG